MADDSFSTTPLETPTPADKLLGAPNPERQKKNASWGALISIIIILAMIVIGAFYTWGQRVAEQHANESQAQSQ